MRTPILLLSLLLYGCSDESLPIPSGPDGAADLSFDSSQPRPDAALPPHDGCPTINLGQWKWKRGEIPGYYAEAQQPLPFPGTLNVDLIPEEVRSGEYVKAYLQATRDPMPPEPGYTGNTTIYISGIDSGVPHGNMDSARLADDSGHCLELPESVF